LALVLPAWLAASASPPPTSPQDKDGVSGLLRRIRDEVLGLERYPGEDFHRGEFHLGPGDDDTHKTHAVGILVRGPDESYRTTIQVSRLDRSEGDPNVYYAGEPRTVVCAFAGREAEIVRSDYSPGELEKLLPAVLRAVLDKKALLKRGGEGPSPPPRPAPAATCP
jgi:hypothetical protein